MANLTQDDLVDLPRPPGRYERHRPESTLLYQIIQEHWPRFQDQLARQGKLLPVYVVHEFEQYLKCGRLEHGFLRVQCEACHAEKLLAFSCKRRGFCGSCGARRMADSAAHLVDRNAGPFVFPEQPVRQWVLSVPYQLRYLLATQPEVITKVLAIVHRVISTSLIKRAGLTVKSGAQTGAVTLIQLFGSALNSNRDAAPPHFHLIYVDGVFNRQGHFYRLRGPAPTELDALTHQIAQRASRYLEKVGYLIRDEESAYLDLQADDEGAMASIVSASSEASHRSYRLAFGPNAGLGVPAETH